MKRIDSSDDAIVRAHEWPVIEAWREDDGVYVNVREAFDQDSDDFSTENVAEIAPVD